jgi:hypothetical protein
MSSQLAVVLALLVLSCPGTALCGGAPAGFAITNLASDNVSVVWVSTRVEAGSVEFATSAADLVARTGSFTTARDDAGPARVHHVTLGELSTLDNRLLGGQSPLRSATDYVFDVISGGVRNDNGGAHFGLRTPAALPPRLSRPQPVLV